MVAAWPKVAAAAKQAVRKHDDHKQENRRQGDHDQKALSHGIQCLPIRFLKDAFICASCREPDGISIPSLVWPATCPVSSERPNAAPARILPNQPMASRLATTRME